MSKTDTKNALIQVGTRFIIENGYNHTGLNEVLAEAGVPKGSFYYYFSSKEDFGLQVIGNFESSNKAALKLYLEDENYNPLDRLKRYFQTNIEYLVSSECRQGCLVGNLGQELSDLNDTFRLKVKQVMDNWASSLAACIRLAQQEGQINSNMDPQVLGEFCLSSWQGAVLRMKIAKNKSPLDNFWSLMFDVVLT